MNDLVFIPIPRNASGSVRTALSEKKHFYTFDFLESIQPYTEPVLHLTNENSCWKFIQQKLLTESVSWKKAKKFAIIRNPWSRVVSMFYHDAANIGSQSFSSFLKSLPAIVQGKIYLASCRSRVMIPYRANCPTEGLWLHPDCSRIQYHVLPQFCHFWQPESGSVLDNLIKYESLELDLNNFLEQNGHPPVKLDNINYSAKNKLRIGKSTEKHYSEYYTEDWMIKLVELLYKKDIELGNYSFD